MGRRRASARFLPDQYVFPGGRVESCDYRAALTAPIALDSPVPDPRVLGASPRMGHVQALCQAAARESVEETGLQLQPRAALTYLGRAITPTLSPVRFHARFFAAPLLSFSGAMGGDEELLDLRWIKLAQIADVPMIDVTVFMLRLLEQRLRGTAPGWARMTYVGQSARTLFTPFPSGATFVQ